LSPRDAALAASAAVEVHDLHVVLGGNPILSGLDLEVRPGELLVLLGPSGCGKSTLLHAIAGLVDVSGGAIVIGGRDVTWVDPKDRGIGMVFQSYALYPTMSVERNLSFSLRIARMARAEIARRVQRAAEMLQLTELLHRKPSQLSGGQRQRVAIGRALVREVGVYLLDEPLSNLDAKLRSELRRELKLLHHELGATMVYVTHDQVEAMTLASRIAVMRSGHIQQIGTPAEVYHRPANQFVAGFLGSPGMNFVPGQVAAAGAGLRFAGAGLTIDLDGYPFREAPAPGRKVRLGVRPEHLSLSAAGRARETSDGVVRLGSARTLLSEPLGSLSLVWIETGGQRLGVQVAGGAEPEAGAEVDVLAEAGRVSLFDQESERRL
jgi:multiple sugar transport system ATP-binding protein